MWRFLYNCLLLLAAPVILGILLAKPRCRRGLARRLGWEDHDGEPDKSDRPVIWVHAVSLGEVVAAVPLVKELHRRHPGYRYIVTTVTETGREAVEQRLTGVAEHRYAPLDFPWVVTRIIKRWRPRLYLFVETELWPNLLWTLHRRRIPSVLVNGRLSSRSFRRQNVAVIRSFYHSVLHGVSLCLMQSARDAERIRALGADPSRVHVTGNIKFDQPLPPTQTAAALRSSLGVHDGEDLLLAGSTHGGEEEQLVAAYQQIVRTHPSAVLMLAPRHLERVERLAATIREAGLRVERKSRIQGTGLVTGPRVILLDTRGELAGAYQAATVTFVGGTLIPVGGHNLLEPAVWGKPVLFGPYTDHCAEVATLLRQAGGGYCVSGAEDIARYTTEWLTDHQAGDAVGGAARRVVVENQGALERSVALIEGCLNETSPPVRAPVAPITGSVAARP